MLQLVAAALGRPAEQLVELDRRSLRLAFVPGEFATVTVRDRLTREVLEATIDLASGAAADPSALRGRNRQAALSLSAPGRGALWPPNLARSPTVVNR